MLAESPTTDALRAAFARELADEPRLRWKFQGLRDGAATYVLGSLIEDVKKPVLVVTDGAAKAEHVAGALRAVLGDSLDGDFLSRRVHTLPAREAPPLEMVSPPAEMEAGRMAALYQIARGSAPVVVASITALAARTVPPEELLASCIYLVIRDELDRDDLAYKLDGLGYRRVGVVEEPGEIAFRGGIIDVWPPGSGLPCRCELFGDTIDSMRTFDPGDQRSVASVEDLVVLPARPFRFDRLAAPEVRRAVHDRCNELLLAASERRQLDASMTAGVQFPGAELLLPYVCNRSAWFVDYLPENTVTVVLGAARVDGSIESWKHSLEEARVAAAEAGTFHPSVEDLYADSTELRRLLERRPLVELDETEAIESSGKTGERVWCVNVRNNESLHAARVRARHSRGEERLKPMIDELTALREDGSRLVVVASDRTQLARIEHLLGLCGLTGARHVGGLAEASRFEPGSLLLLQGCLESGFRLPGDGLAVVTDEDLFGRQRRPTRRPRVSRARALTALSEAKPGDYMVHVDHGIGLYRGLKHLVVGDTEGDFIHLEYAGGDRYYLPVDRINLVAKYAGSGSAAPPLSRLGSAAWVRTKKRAKESVLKLASDLLDLEAYRAVHRRDVFAHADADYEEFEAQFPFEETEGQKQTVTQIVADLTADKPMDRVVCGDVGYGKTEVALRAAYMTVMGGKQVAFLVPTTVLARQHRDTIRQRFADYPVSVAMLSRFNSRTTNREIVDGLADGTVDIVVGTHRLLQKDVSFARLGLLVIDEEHRFGVQAKEKLKKMRREVDVLTMTATPIPRTLQLALAGVRDLSLIETPPVDRLAIRTYVARYEEGLIKKAIERELARNGQVFFVHHRVASIDAIARRVVELVPSARVVTAHGQMREADLERVMIDFLAGETDVLVCTSIIESGLDIANANTIIINRADAFGLAQLYQIRGRVGRSSRRAYAYLLVPGEKLISDDARRRLAVLQELDDLGSGFRLAAHDMEIRGAGNLLGKEQSGHIAAIGFDLFMRMMEEASQELRGRTRSPEIEPEIELGAEAFLPAEYVDDVGERLLCYKRMANATTVAALDAIVEELSDRFGPPPDPVRDLVRVMALRPILKRLAVESLKASDHIVALRFHDSSPIDPTVLVALANSDPGRYRLRPGGILTMNLETGDWNAMVDEIAALLEALGEHLEERHDDEGNTDAQARLG